MTDMYTQCRYCKEGIVKIRVKKWGNSLGIRIPKVYAKEANIDQDSEVMISIKDGKLILKAIDKNVYNLKDLLALITNDNLHEEIELGDAMGREII